MNEDKNVNVWIICYEYLTPYTDPCSMPCGHIYHHECIQNWIDANKNWPKCRKELKERPVIIKAMITQDTFDMYVRLTKVDFEK